METEGSEVSQLEITFNRASKHFASLVSSLDSDALLHFYARYKQATEGDCNVSKPSFFNMSARRKWDAWNKLSGISKSVAMEEYISGVRERDPDWNESTDVGWARVSRMPIPTDNEAADVSPFLSAVRAGNLAALEEMQLDHYVKEVFDEGMTGLHWASDHGMEEVAELLLRRGANVNAQDGSGQTALHYAASCGHNHLLHLLLLHKADTTITDQEGLTPKQVAEEDMQHLL